MFKSRLKFLLARKGERYASALTKMNLLNKVHKSYGKIQLKNFEILWANTSEPYNYTQAKQIGCHIITLLLMTIDKIENFGKSFYNLTTDTVKTFLLDAQKSNFKI